MSLFNEMMEEESKLRIENERLNRIIDYALGPDTRKWYEGEIDRLKKAEIERKNEKFKREWGKFRGISD